MDRETERRDDAARPSPGATLRAYADRRAPAPPPGNAVTDLLAGASERDLAERRGLPLAAARGVRSFYELVDDVPRLCDGTACHFHGGEALRRRLVEDGAIAPVRCLGHCYAAPSFQTGDRVFARPRGQGVEGWLEEWGEGPSPMPDYQPMPRRSIDGAPIVLRHLLPGAPRAGLDEYELPDADAILRGLEAARLRGRGGAAYPTAAKWRAARDTPADRRYVVANGDEGDPGSFADRLLLEEAPHSVLAGMLACARVIGARHGVVYVRGEYPLARLRVLQAIDEARSAGRLGDAFDIEVVSGAGSYVCGEETALLRSIEGLRGEPSPKPPFPAQRGLFGAPTIVQNVETLSLVPWVAREARPVGRKAMSLSGRVATPGLVEAPLGIPLRDLLQRGGGGPAEGSTWRMALIGGPMGRVIPAARFDVPLSYEGLSGLGHGGVVVLDDRVSPRALAEHLFAFARAESCGSCTPCRVGSARLAEMRDPARLGRLLDTMEIGSLCGFGQGVPRPIRDLLEQYGDEVCR
jgi:NADH:ubiquinone oxidoreductase subunit F (NADH-binding)